MNEMLLVFLRLNLNVQQRHLNDEMPFVPVLTSNFTEIIYLLIRVDEVFDYTLDVI